MYAAFPQCGFIAGRVMWCRKYECGRTSVQSGGRRRRTAGPERRQERPMNVADPDEAGPNALGGRTGKQAGL